MKLVGSGHFYVVPHFRGIFSLLREYLLNLFSDGIYQAKVQLYSYFAKGMFNNY